MIDDPRIPPIDPGADGGESARGRPDVSDEELGRRLSAVLRSRARNVEAPRGEAVRRVRAAQRAAASRRRRIVRPAVVLGVAAVLTAAGLGAVALLARPQRLNPHPTGTLAADRSTPSPTASASFAPSPPPFPKLAEVSGSFDLLTPAPSLNALAYGDPLHGWAAADGAILTSRDGGASWVTVWKGSERVLEVHALGTLKAWALAEPPMPGGAGPGGLNPDTLLTTTDAGQTWQTVRLATPVVDLQLVADGQAWALSLPASDPTATQHLLHTTDGGRTWQQALPGAVAALCFADAQRGWAVGTNVLRTTDAGAHWATVAHLSTSLGLGSDLVCRDGTLWLMDRGPVGSAGGASFSYDLRRSTDGGLTWAPILSNAPYPRPGGVVAGPDQVAAFDAPDSDTAFVLGLAGDAPATMVSVTHDGGRTWVTNTLPVPAMDPSAAVATDDGHAWFAGDRLSPGTSTGLLAATTDGGATWRERWPSAGLRPIESVDFVSADTGFGLGAFGDPAAVLRTDDGGRSWRQTGRLLATLTSSATSALGVGWSFVGPEDGWALDGTGLERTTDGGRSWALTALPTVAAHPYAVAFSDASQGCLLATDPNSFLHALRTADGGLTWIEAPGAQSSVVACAWGQVGAALLASAQQVTGTRSDIDVSQLVIADPDHAWAAGQDSILHTTDGGARWETVTADAALSPGALAALTFATGQDGWMLTFDGRLLRTHDGGVSWTELP